MNKLCNEVRKTIDSGHIFEFFEPGMLIQLLFQESHSVVSSSCQWKIRLSGDEMYGATQPNRSSVGVPAPNTSKQTSLNGCKN